MQVPPQAPVVGREQIREYLFGVLPEAEHERVERALFEQDAGLEQIEAAERELITEYVRGRLNRADRQRFETAYLGIPQRARKVQALRRELGGRMPRVVWILLAMSAAALAWVGMQQERGKESARTLRARVVVEQVSRQESKEAKAEKVAAPKAYTRVQKRAAVAEALPEDEYDDGAPYQEPKRRWWRGLPERAEVREAERPRDTVEVYRSGEVLAGGVSGVAVAQGKQAEQVKRRRIPAPLRWVGKAVRGLGGKDRKPEEGAGAGNER